MKKQALVLGLTAFLYSFLFLPLGIQVLIWMNLNLSLKVTSLVCMAAAFLVAWKLAPVVEGEDEPPPLLTMLLFYSAGYFLLFKLLGSFGIGFGYNKFSMFLHRVEGWALVVVALAVSRLFKPRLMLFVGLAVFAFKFQAVFVLAPLVLNLPKWLLNLVSLVVAVLIARSFCVGADSPADRVSKPLFLWLFAAASTLVLIADSGGMLLYGWKEKVVLLAFLLTFVLMVDSVADQDSGPAAAGLGADYGRLFLIFIAFLVVVERVFQFSEVVDDGFPYRWGGGTRIWLTLLSCAAVAVAIMKYLNIGARLPGYPPGRKAILWGAILWGIAVLAGGNILGGVSDNAGSFELLIGLVYLAVLVGPIATLAVILLGTGLLKLLFSLNARPRG